MHSRQDFRTRPSLDIFLWLAWQEASISFNGIGFLRRQSPISGLIHAKRCFDRCHNSPLANLAILFVLQASSSAQSSAQSSYSWLSSSDSSTLSSYLTMKHEDYILYGAVDCCICPIWLSLSLSQTKIASLFLVVYGVISVYDLVSFPRIESIKWVISSRDASPWRATLLSWERKMSVL